MSGLLAGRRALVTGAAQGIGLAVARAYLEHGASVVLTDVNEPALHAAAAEFSSDRVSAHALDVSDADAVERLADAVGDIDVVVANAGILVLRPAVEMDAATWRRVLDVNLTGAFLTCTAFARRMRAARRPGRIILTSSLFGLRGGSGNAAYSASKFGVVGFAQCLAAELAPEAILVNCVCPGQIESDMIAALFHTRANGDAERAAQLRQDFERRIPVGHLGRVADLAGTYVWLASELSNYVTGQSIVVDGGWQVG